MIAYPYLGILYGSLFFFFFFVGAVLYAIVLIVSIPPAEGVDYDDALTKLRDRLTIGLQLPDDAVEREEPTNTRGLRGK